MTIVYGRKEEEEEEDENHLHLNKLMTEIARLDGEFEVHFGAKFKSYKIVTSLNKIIVYL